MTTPWISRRERRRDEQVLTGHGPAGDPVVRLLADAGRIPEGPLTGEAAAVAAFRAAGDPGTASSLATSVPTPLRSSDVRTFTVRRLVAAKALAIGAAVTTVGGVAFAATHDALPFSPVGHGTALPGAGASTHPSGAADADGDHSRPAWPSGAPTHSPRPSWDADKGRKGDAKQFQLAVACQVWKMTSSNKALPADVKLEVPRNELLQALYKAAGGQDKVAAFCTQLTTDLCKQWQANWPGAKGLPGAMASTVQKPGDLCPFDLTHWLKVKPGPGLLPTPTMTFPPGMPGKPVGPGDPHGWGDSSIPPFPAPGPANRA